MAIKIPLTQGKCAIVDEQDYEPVSGCKWRLICGRYAAAIISGNCVLMHRLLLAATAQEIVKHINGNGLDNRRANLKKIAKRDHIRDHTAKMRENRQSIPLEKRFWKYVDKDGPNGCWLWTGTLRPDGYGVIGRGGRGQGLERANRLSYMIHFGQIPDGMFVCHKCDNPTCVNPEHLFLGSPGDNCHDMVKKKRNAHGETSYAKLTTEQVVEIRRIYSLGGISQIKIADRYGISRSHVSLIVRGERWQHVET